MLTRHLVLVTFTDVATYGIRNVDGDRRFVDEQLREALVPVFSPNLSNMRIAYDYWVRGVSVDVYKYDDEPRDAYINPISRHVFGMDVRGPLVLTGLSQVGLSNEKMLKLRNDLTARYRLVLAPWPGREPDEECGR